MTTVDLGKITAGFSSTWGGHLRDWNRTLRATNHPDTTRDNYLIAGVQLACYLAANAEADPAVHDPTAVSKGQLEELHAWMIQTRSGATALNTYKGPQQFFKWLTEEEEITRLPMERVRLAKTPTTLIPIFGDIDTRRVLDACNGTRYVNLRDEAIVRMLYNTGTQLSEVADPHVQDLNVDTATVHYRGKGKQGAAGPVRCQGRPRTQPLPTCPPTTPRFLPTRAVAGRTRRPTPSPRTASRSWCGSAAYRPASRASTPTDGETFLGINHIGYDNAAWPYVY